MVLNTVRHTVDLFIAWTQKASSCGCYECEIYTRTRGRALSPIGHISRQGGIALRLSACVQCIPVPCTDYHYGVVSPCHASELRTTHKFYVESRLCITAGWAVGGTRQFTTRRRTVASPISPRRTSIQSTSDTSCGPLSGLYAASGVWSSSVPVQVSAIRDRSGSEGIYSGLRGRWIGWPWMQLKSQVSPSGIPAHHVPQLCYSPPGGGAPNY